MGKKRGKDNTWLLCKYKGDMAIYAVCKCGFDYPCFSYDNWRVSIIRNEKGKREVVDDTKMRWLNYCPWCGAKKKYYNNIVKEKGEKWVHGWW